MLMGKRMNLVLNYPNLMIGDFVYLFSVAQFWSSPLINKFPSSPDILSGSLWSRGLKNVSKSITRGNSHKDFGFSVRCIRDK